MPKIVTSGEKSKNPGRKFLVYDPAIAGDMPTHWQKMYDEQRDAQAKANALTDKFKAMVLADASKQGNTESLAVFLNFGKISVTIDDGNGRRASKVPQVKPTEVNWANVGAALKA